MQPETETLPNGKKVVVNDEGRKPKVKDVAEMTGPEQWDQLAFKLMLQELAPKGFSEIKRGPYRGTVQSNIPFLPKKTVQRCQNLAAQCVRSYRERIIKSCDARVKYIQEQVGKVEVDFKSAMLWHFKRKALCRKLSTIYYTELDNIKTFVSILNNTGIK